MLAALATTVLTGALAGVTAAAFLAVFLPRGRAAWHTFAWSLGASIVLWSSLAPRVQNSALASAPLDDPSAPWRIVLRAVPILVLAFLGVAVLRRALTSRSEPVSAPRQAAIVAVAAVWISFAATIVFGPPRIIDVGTLTGFVFPAAVTTLLILPAPRTAVVINTLRFSLGVIVYGSLVALLLFPDWALLLDRGSVISPLPDRLAGLAPHPNHLGFASIAFLILGITNTSRYEWAHRVVGMLVLFLTASKTAWAIAAVTLVIVLLMGRTVGRSLAARVGLGVLSFSLVAIAILALWSSVDEESRTNLTTFTGRTQVWAIAVDLWQSRPVFGHGTEAWGATSDARREYAWAGHAHNQLLHTLSANGLFGAFALLAYTAVLIRLAVRSASVIAYALVAHHLVAFVTEAPVNSTVIDVNFLVHLTIVVVVAYLGERSVPGQDTIHAEARP